jgi:hypothetical protein
MFFETILTFVLRIFKTQKCFYKKTGFFLNIYPHTENSNKSTKNDVFLGLFWHDGKICFNENLLTYFCTRKSFLKYFDILQDPHTFEKNIKILARTFRFWNFNFEFLNKNLKVVFGPINFGQNHFVSYEV